MRGAPDWVVEVLSPSTTSYDHRSLLSLTMKAIGVANIPNGADAAPQMTEFFK